MQQLTERQRRILKAVVAEHVASAQPVGSESVARQLRKTVSPATIRNEMAELEEAGYLYHPHTSAGRLPAEKGYRYFVQSLLEEHELALDTRMAIRRRFTAKDLVIDEWLNLAAEVLASVVRSTAVISAPRSSESTLKHLQLVSVHETLALLVIVLHDGTVRQQFLPFAETVLQDQATAVANYLNAKLAGRTVAQIQTSSEPFSVIESQVFEAVLRVMHQVDEGRYWDIYYDGVGYMLAQPEFDRSEKIRQVLDLLSERHTLANIMVGAVAGDEMRVIVGSGDEKAGFPLRDCSLVVGRYGNDSTAPGVLAVLGPMRMEYDRAISSVRYLATVLNELLAELYGWKR
jgi:heat-inducible transcriptional repressor